MDIYEQLQEKLNTHPAGAPDRPEIREILRILFTPEEAAFAVQLPLAPQPVQEIAKKLGRPVEEVATACEKLADKGLVLALSARGQRVYMLLPTAPGIYEFPLMKHKHLNFDFERLGQLWQQYYDSGWGLELHGSKTNMSRVIPVHKAIPFALNILPFEQASHYIDKAEYISVADCPCRFSQKKCDNPIEVCLGFDRTAQFLTERKMARLISKEEALKILEKADESGLVHCTSNTLDRIEYICNCCPCCCGILGAATRLKGTASHPVSNFYSTVHTQTCNGCRICEDRCPVKAISMNEAAIVDTDLCLGCGLCASACPTEAITLRRKADSVEPPKRGRDLYLQVAQEKGRLDAFLANSTL